jgi:hypothetical protein
LSELAAATLTSGCEANFSRAPLLAEGSNLSLIKKLPA